MTAPVVVPPGLVDFSTLTGRDLRRDRSVTPGGENFPAVVQRFLPSVHGTALALIPESPASAEEISLAVFETLAHRWKRIPRKMFVAVWLLQTTIFAVGRERRRLNLSKKPGTPAAVQTAKLFKFLLASKKAWRGPLLLNLVFQQPVDAIAATIRTKPARVQKWIARAEGRLAKKCRMPLPLLQEELLRLPVAPSEDVVARIVSSMASWNRSQPKRLLTAKTIAAWRWLKFFTIARRVGATVGTIVALMFLTALTAQFLFQKGSFIAMMIKNGQMQTAKEFPEMTKPATPFAGLATAPKSVAELYGTTNIWAATIRMTPKEWKAVQPAHIEPVENLNEGGRLKLRNPKASRSGLAGALGFDFPWSNGDLEFAGEKFDDVGVRIRGNGTYLNSLWGNKQSYKVDLNRNVSGQDLVGINSLNFVNSIPDFSYLKDALGQKVFRELGAVSPRTAYAYLSIDVPGTFTNQALGLYVLIEDVGGDFAKLHFGSKAAPIFKPVTYDLFGDWGDGWDAYAEIYDLKTKATEGQKRRVIDFAKLVSHASDGEFAKRLPEFLDLEEYAAFVAGHVLMSSYDGYLVNGQNFYMYLDPRSNKFGFIPWDQDHGWGEFGHVGKAAKRENASIWNPAVYENKFLKRVMKVEEFRKIYRQKLEQGLAGPFTVERLYREIDSLAAIIRPAVAAESKFRLDRFEIALSTNWVSGPRDPTGMHDAEGPKAPAHQLKRFVLARTKSVREQLDGKHQGDRL